MSRVRVAIWLPLAAMSTITALALVTTTGGCGGDELADSAGETGQRSFAITATVEQWRELVEKHFKKQHVTWGLNIIQCESGGNPNAYNASSGASGLFQHLQKYWPARAAAAGFAGYSPFHAEANIAASAYLLYAPGGGTSHWSCKHSPFEDWSYEPKFYDDGVPVKRCTPHCDGSKKVDADCNVGDCGKYGARCVNDALGLRCVFVYCPAIGERTICLDDREIADCDDGKLSNKRDCGEREAYCSTAGVQNARCTSVYCVSSAEQKPVAHRTCLPDGRLGRCSSAGTLESASSCLGGQVCVADGDSGRCADPDEARPDDQVIDQDPAAGSDAGLSVSGSDGGVLPRAQAQPYQGHNTIEGVGCSLASGGDHDGAGATLLPIVIVTALALVAGRRRRRRWPRAGAQAAASQ